MDFLGKDMKILLYSVTTTTQFSIGTTMLHHRKILNINENVINGYFIGMPMCGTE